MDEMNKRCVVDLLILVSVSVWVCFSFWEVSRGDRLNFRADYKCVEH